jgi:putative endopeptidase
MAQAQMDNVARRDPKNLNNKMSLEQVQALTPSFDWKHYIEVVEAPPSSPHYIVASPQFFRGLEPLIQKHSVDDWKVYLRWHLVHGSAPYLDKAFVDENWNFYPTHCSEQNSNCLVGVAACALPIATSEWPWDRHT